MSEEITKATPKHIESVRKRIEEIKKGISGNFLTLGELLKEVRDGGYHLSWNFKTFGLWLESSGLDMSERAAYYLVKIVEMGQELSIPREKLEAVKLSKLKELTTLDPKKHGNKIKQLIDGCIRDKEGNELTLEDVREQVQKIKGGSEEVDTYVFVHLKFTKTTKEEVFDPAVEFARAEYGDTINSNNPEGDEPAEITPSRAIEMILADYLSGVHKDKAPYVPEQKSLPFGPTEVVERVSDNQTEFTFVDAEVLPPEELHNCAVEGVEKTPEPQPDPDRALQMIPEVENDPVNEVPEPSETPVLTIAEKLAALKAERRPTLEQVEEKITEGKERRAKAFKEISSSGPDLDPTNDPVFEQVKEYIRKNKETASALRIKNVFNIGLERAERLYKYISTPKEESEAV